jgi:hypothetical protein
MVELRYCVLACLVINTGVNVVNGRENKSKKKTAKPRDAESDGENTSEMSSFVIATYVFC